MSRRVRWKKIQGYVLLPGALLLAVVALLHLTLSLDMERNKRPHVYENKYLLPNSEVIAATTLNHKTAAASLIWLSGVQHVGASYVARRGSRDVTRYAHTIIDLDPYFYKVYSWHSGARISLAGKPQLEDIDAANDILKQGLSYFPQDWRLPYEVTSNYIGFEFIQHLDRSKRLEQVEDAYEHASRGSMMPGAPDVLGLLASSFQRKTARMRAGHAENERVDADLSDGDKELLARLYLTSDAKHVRELALARLERAGGAEELTRQIRHFRTVMEDCWSASELGYLPPSVFVQVDNRLQACHPD